MSQSVRFAPVSLFGAAMGIGGLGLACRAAIDVLGLPSAFSMVLVGLGAIVLLVLLITYAAKWSRYPDAARAELANPAQMGFAATLPLALCIVAGGLGPYAALVADALWWIGYALLCVVIVASLVRWLDGGIDLVNVNTGWMLALVSGVVIPVAGVPLDHMESSRFIFGVGLMFAPFVIGIVFYRMVVAPPLPDAMKPTWAIYAVPSAMIYINYAPLAGEPAGLAINGSFYVTLVVACALLLKFRHSMRWPFTPAWWAFTFPADAVAGAAIRYASVNASGPAYAVAWTTLALAAIIVTLVSARTLVALGRGQMLLPPPTMPAPALTPEVSR